LRPITHPTDNLQALSIVSCSAKLQYRLLIWVRLHATLKFWRYDEIAQDSRSFALFLATSSAVTARPKECSNLTIKGTYAFTVHGQILTLNAALIVNGIAKTTFDGTGNLTQVDAVEVNGNIAEVWRPGTGTYTLNPDCTGTMTISNRDQAPLHLAILVSHSGASPTPL
jgi:hypothetical protein